MAEEGHRNGVADDAPLPSNFSPFLLPEVSAQWVQIDSMGRAAGTLDTESIEWLDRLRLRCPLQSGSEIEEIIVDILSRAHSAARKSPEDYFATLMDGWCPIECFRLIECAKALLGLNPPSSFGIDGTRSLLKEALTRSIDACQQFFDENFEESDIFLEGGKKLGAILLELDNAMGLNWHTPPNSAHYMEVDSFCYLAQMLKSSCELWFQSTLGILKPGWLVPANHIVEGRNHNIIFRQDGVHTLDLLCSGAYHIHTINSHYYLYRPIEGHSMQSAIGEARGRMRDRLRNFLRCSYPAKKRKRSSPPALEGGQPPSDQPRYPLFKDPPVNAISTSNSSGNIAIQIPAGMVQQILQLPRLTR
jgi:hypothetical protein